MKSQFQQATLATYIASIIPMYVGFSIIHSEFLIIFGLTIIILNSIIKPRVEETLELIR